jgi:tetratricopeptide (TPR) repeat protein
VSVTFAATQPRHFDWMPRLQTLQEAQQLGRSANVHNPHAEQALLQAFRKACLQQETWLLEDARTGYQRLAGILGENALCYTKIAETWLLDNKLEPALEAYSEAIEIRPDYLWAHLGMGNVLQLQGKPLDAEAAYHKALDFEPTSVAVKRRLAAVRSDALAARATQLQNSGDNVGAIDLLKTVILEQPDNEIACASLDVLLRMSSPVKHGNKTRLPSYMENVTKACRLLNVVLDEAEKRLSAMSAN